MERKLATVLFVDLVDSTRLVTGTDPEVVRRRVTQFFEHGLALRRAARRHRREVRRRRRHGRVRRPAGARGRRRSARRARRSPSATRSTSSSSRRASGSRPARSSSTSSDSTFATGEAVNLAARLQQAARPGEILIGPTAHRLAAGSLVVEDAGPLELKGIDGPLRAWRVVDMLDGPGRPSAPRAPLVGREIRARAAREHVQRAACATGARTSSRSTASPGVGKSRLAREFLDGVEGASVLMGRALPYGEGVTYWPLAEMVKAAAGISDDDPLEEAFEKLRECCADEAVADLLGLAVRAHGGGRGRAQPAGDRLGARAR